MIMKLLRHSSEVTGIIWPCPVREHVSFGITDLAELLLDKHKVQRPHPHHKGGEAIEDESELAHCEHEKDFVHHAGKHHYLDLLKQASRTYIMVLDAVIENMFGCPR